MGYHGEDFLGGGGGEGGGGEEPDGEVAVVGVPDWEVTEDSAIAV